MIRTVDDDRPPGRGGHSADQGRRFLAPLLDLGLAVLVTASVWRAPGGRLLGSPDVDVWNHAWGPWWWADSLRQGQLPWHTELLRWPVGGTLWFIDPALAAVGAPLTWAFGPALAFNLALLLSVALTAAACRHLARQLGADPPAATVAAAAGAGSAWVACALHNGITEAAHLAPTALALAETARALRIPGPRAGTRLGLALGLAAAVSPYAGLAVGVVVAARLLLGPLARRDLVRTALPAALAGAAVAAGPTALLLASLRGPDAMIRRSPQLDAELALHNAVDPRTFVTPGGFQSVDLSAEGFIHLGYLGLFALALAAVGLRRNPDNRRWAVAGFLAVILASGGQLFFDGRFVSLGGQPVVLPWGLLKAVLPGLAITHPLRMVMPAVVLVAALAAVALTGRRRVLVAAATAGVLVDGLVLSGAPWPIATADAAIPAVYADIARPLGQPPGEAILDLPTDLGPTMGASRYLYWQTAHRRPIPYIPDARATTASLVSLPDFRHLAALSRRRPEEDAAENFRSALYGPVRPAHLLREGLRWVILHRDLDPVAAATLEPRLRWYLGPPTEVGPDLRWDLGRRPPVHRGPPPWAERDERRRRREALPPAP
ncbi:MAG: hypothetical protein D6798_04275 [Deltaproteobacteria bacterium]|nr:MAG: hypothetical protein D6798_04275 [Deltaproteobacteria bacterium]